MNPAFKKSTLYYTCAMAAWTVFITWAFMNVFYYPQIGQVHRPIDSFYPVMAFLSVAIGILLTRKGLQLYNIERGKPLNAKISQAKTVELITYATVSLWVIIAIAFFVNYLEHRPIN